MTGVEVTLKIPPQVVKEALSRMGIANRIERVLYQSCYLLSYEDRWYIAHFKELFPVINGGLCNTDETDTGRRNTIIHLLQRWGLVTIVDQIPDDDKFVYVLKNADKDQWTIRHKININTLAKAERLGFTK